MKYLFAAAALTVLAATPAAACNDAAAKMMAAQAGAAYTPARIPVDKMLHAINTAMSKGDMKACMKAMKMKKK